MDKEIEDWLRKNGIDELTEVQSRAMEPIMAGKNVLITAPTGYGKTLAAIIPIFSIIKRFKDEGLQLLYIAPTKSLNRDILVRVVDFAKELGLSVDIRYGDTSSYRRRKQVDNPPNLLITTPESLQSMMIGSRMRKNLESVKYVVVDEIHELVSTKRGAQLTLGLERLERLASFSRVGISATIADMREVGRFLCGDREFEIVDIEKTKRFEIEVVKPEEDKSLLKLSRKARLGLTLTTIVNKMAQDISSHTRTIIFVNTRQQAEIISFAFKTLFPDLPIGLHHSSLSKRQRIEMENKLRSGAIKAMVATSSMELGIDVGSIDLVIQFMSPRQVNKLVQRIGRSGHLFYKKSVGKIYTVNDDDYLESLAIVELMKKGFLEKPTIPFNPLDVLAHQVIGFVRDDSSISIDELLNSINRSYCFDLDKDRFMEFLDFLSSLNYLKVDGDKIVLTKSAYFYYFQNVSTIPDTKSYKVFDIGTKNRIGTLHSSFVSQYCTPGQKIIMKGEPWEVLELKEDSVNVAKAKSFEAAIPTWSGELIPVSREIAELVGTLRKDYFDGEFVPDNNSFYVERFENHLIFHSCFGSKINNTLSIVLSSLIGSRLGRTVGVRSDPYRVIITTPSPFSLLEFKKTLSSLKPEMVYDLVRLSVKNMTIFNLRFFNVGQRFGIIRKGAEYLNSYVDRVVSFYENSPIYTETLNEIMREKTDIEGTAELISRLKVVYSRWSKVSEIGFNGLNFGAFGGIFRIDDDEKEILEIVKERLMNKRFYFKCMNCNLNLGEHSVGEFPYKSCPNCSARLIGFAPTEDNISFMKESAELFLTYGMKAAFVLAGYGVGIRNGKRILADSPNLDEMVRSIIREERKFVRTRRFWSDKT